MAKRLNFTKRVLDALEPPADGRVYVYDTKTPNLALCVTAAGNKTFYRYGKVRGRPQRIHIGKFPAVSVEDARTTCTDISGKVARGDDPRQGHRRRGGLSFRQLFDKYLDLYARPFKKTWAHDEYQFNKYLAPWHDRRIHDVTRADVQEFHVRLGETVGQTSANRVKSLLSKLYTFAIEQGLHDRNPCYKVKKFTERSRDRKLEADEIPRLFAELDKEPNQTFADFIRMALYVGARRGNTLAMRWEDISLTRQEWRIPETKSGQSLVVPLASTPMKILKRRRKATGNSPWVFPSRSGSGHLASPRKTWLRLCERAKIKGLTIHDLRRSFASWQVATGASETVIGKSLGHAAGSRATSVYARANLDAVRRSAEAATTAMQAAAKKGGGR